MPEVKSTCCYCGVGCGLIIETQNDKIIGVKGDPNHPANFGRLCTKGSTLHQSTDLTLRALHPELRKTKTSPYQKVDWENALDYATDRFAEIIKTYGAEAVAIYGSGQLLTEDYYVFNKLMKGLIGTNNLDTNSRLCMSSAVVGYKKAFGVDAPPTCYDDLNYADCIFITGANPAFAHPIVFRRLEQARENNPKQKLIVVDPRFTDTAQLADLYLPIKMGTDVALYHGMLHIMLWENWINHDYIQQFTTGFEDLKKTVRNYTPQTVADVCGISTDDLYLATEWFAKSTSTLSLYCQGLNQSSSGVDKNSALINLHLATGQIGREGAGPFSLTGQPNAMGGREVGGMANLASAHRDLANPQHRQEIADYWGVESVPEQTGKTAVDLFEAVRKGEIKALWIVCTNPAQSMPNLNLIHEALQNVEFLIVQEAFRYTDTTQFADLILPACTWGEKEGTVTNSERRISRVRRAIQPPAETRPDWDIASDFARRLGQKLNKISPKFNYKNTEEIFNEHKGLTKGRDLDITGLSYDILEEKGSQFWPFPEGAIEGKSRLYTDGQFETPDKKAKFINMEFKLPAEAISPKYPIRLNTGRLRDQWHGMSRTGTVPTLFNHVEMPYLSMHETDMALRGIHNDDILKVESRRGSMIVAVKMDENIQAGEAFFPMHWGNQFLNSLGVNALTIDTTDPMSRQPELKHSAIRVEKLNLPYHMILFAQGDCLNKLHQVQAYLGLFDYASCGLSGQNEGIVILRVAHREPINPQLFNELDTIFGLNQEDGLIRYEDQKNAISKRILIHDNQFKAVRLAGEVISASWLKDTLIQSPELNSELINTVKKWGLAPLEQPPTGGVSRGKIVCNCFNISESEISEHIQTQKITTLKDLQNNLKCGTQCGSCIPELKRLLK